MEIASLALRRHNLKPARAADRLWALCSKKIPREIFWDGLECLGVFSTEVDGFELDN